MSGVAERNRAGQFYVNTRIDVAKTKLVDDFPEFSEGTEVYQLLTDLIEINAKGFRGVVITAFVGMHLNSDYNPLNDFYQCNPRAIFEEGIWYALQQNGIPCGKSDPLNVAKNANQLDENWAKGRRPQSAAMAVVRFLQIVVNEKRSKQARLIDYFFFRLWTYAQKIAAYKMVHVDAVQKSHLEIGNKIICFTLAFPEAGQLPQFLVSQLLQAVFERSDITVAGSEESVFGTNTTSKKPADIWLEERGKSINLYEITVKKVSRKRLDDSIDALEKIGYLDCPITFICRLPEDAAELELVNNYVNHRGKYFEFIDYQSFCLSLFALLSAKRIANILIRMSQLVNDVHVSMKTKTGWNELFGADG